MRALCSLLDCILTDYHRLGPSLISKFNLDNAYMISRVRSNYIPSVAFLIPKYTDSEPQLVVFNMSISMGQVESAPLFCAAMDTIKDTENKTMHNRGESPVHPLDIIS